MAKDLNKVMLTGRLGKDIEARFTQNGSQVVTFSVASGRQVKQQDGTYAPQTEWFRVVAWEKLADAMSKLSDMGALKKGSHVFVEGRLQTRKWTDQQGQERYSTEVIANDVMLLDSKKSAGGGDGDDWEETTSAPSNNRNASNNGNRRAAAGNFDEELDPEDVPF